LAGSSREARSDKIYWSTDVSYNPRPREGQKNLTWADAKEDVEAESLLRYLINAKGDDNPMLSFRPSAWTKLTIRRSGDFTGKLSDLTLKVNYVYYSVNDDILSTVVVKVADDAQPLIGCDVEDVNGRSDGQGSFIRTFDHKKRRRVTLRAPTQYGRRAFVGWRIGEPEEGEDGPVPLEHSSKLKLEPVLTLNVKDIRDHLIEPVYEATEFVPVDDKDEPWPPCPTGWGFEDWILVNRSPAKDPIVFDKLDYLPWRGGAGYKPAVNEPLGNNQIKLSFERISLMTGESTKISVSPNPEVQGSAGDQIMFMWKEGYGVFFDGNGALSGLKKWKNNGWVDAKSAFELDKENRTLNFLG
jgi:hypothetical protein